MSSFACEWEVGPPSFTGMVLQVSAARFGCCRPGVVKRGGPAGERAEITWDVVPRWWEGTAEVLGCCLSFSLPPSALVYLPQWGSQAGLQNRLLSPPHAGVRAVLNHMNM